MRRRRAPGASLMQMDARRIPFRDEFDVVGRIRRHRAHRGRPRGAGRAARGGGARAAACCSRCRSTPSCGANIDARAGHVRRYRAAELRGKVMEAGFEIVRMTSFVTLLLPLMLASRLAQRRPAPRLRPARRVEDRAVAQLDAGTGARSRAPVDTRGHPFAGRWLAPGGGAAPQDR